MTVTGTGFDSTEKENNVVKIGNTTCKVTSSTDTQIVCTVGMGPAGLRAVWVSVIGKGAARVGQGKRAFTQVLGAIQVSGKLTPSPPRIANDVGPGTFVMLTISRNEHLHCVR